MKDSLSKFTSYLDRLTQQKVRNKLTSTLAGLTQQNARMDGPQAGAYLMKITTTGIGAGTVIRSPDADSYVNGQVVSLTAKAQAGSKFARWTGDVTGSHFVCNVRMDSDKWVVAEFISADFPANQKITSTFAASLVCGMQKIDTRHPPQVVASLIQSGTSNDANVVEQKDIPPKHIGLKGRFIDHEDGTVSDTRTGLMWMRPALGQTINNGVCRGDAQRFHFTEALALRTEFAGYDDWRLPTIDELRGLIDRSVCPALDKEAFPVPPDSYFWSSTMQASSDEKYANWPIIITLPGGTQGFGNPETGAERLRLVRCKGAKFSVSGDEVVNNVTCIPTPTIDSTKSTLEKFLLENNFELKITSTGNGSGVISRKPEAERYSSGQVVRLTANPQEYSKFSGWHGDVTSKHFVCNVRMNGNISVSAEFSQLEYYELKAAPMGTGSGFITRSHEEEKYSKGSTITLTAQASAGSKFKCWHGDVGGQNATCALTMNSDRTISAEFIKLEYFELKAVPIGTGRGIITCSPKAEKHLQGSAVTLTALPVKGSKFVGWQCDADGSSNSCSVIMDSAKIVKAEFAEIQSFGLACSTEGNGEGSIDWAIKSGQVVANYLEGVRCLEGSVVTLTAIASEGSTFRCWRGDASGSMLTCKVSFDSEKKVVAEFVQLKSYGLYITTTGTGKGSITRNIDADSYYQGSVVTLKAQPTKGSVFVTWRGAASGFDDVCSVKINSQTSVTAEFEKLDIPDIGISVDFESAQDTTMASGDAAIVFYLNIHNNGEKQVRINLPMATYQNRLGEEIEQGNWLTGLVIGGNGATIRAGTFRKTGLVFYKSRLGPLSKGDRLHVCVEQVKPSIRRTYTFQCTGTSPNIFRLIKAISEDLEEPADTSQLLREVSALKLELSVVRFELATTKFHLAVLQEQLEPSNDESHIVVDDAQEKISPSQILKAVVLWLISQKRITVMALRDKLLPLNLLPNAVINELNEMALDLTGELVLEEIDDEIVVTGKILEGILENWDRRQD